MSVPCRMFLPARGNEAAIRPISLPVGGSTRPQVMKYPDDPDVINVGHDVRKLPDMFPVEMVKTAGVPVTRPVVISPKPQAVDDQYDRNMVHIGDDVLDVPDVFSG